MRCFLFCLTLGGLVQGSLSKAGDFPFEAIVLSDGVLLIDKGNGQNWIMETGTPTSPGMPRSWNPLQLPGAAVRSHEAHAPQHRHRPNHGDMRPEAIIGNHPPAMAPGFPIHMNPWPTWSAPQPGMIPPGSYSQAVPLGQPAFSATVPLSTPMTSPEPLTAPEREVRLEREAAAGSVPTREQVPTPDHASLPEHANTPTPSRPDTPLSDSRVRRSASSKPRVSDNDKPNDAENASRGDAHQPTFMVIVSDSEIELDEVLVLRLMPIDSKTNESSQKTISVEYPADGKLVRGGNPSSVKDGAEEATKRVTMSHDGDKPIELVFRFEKPGKKQIRVSLTSSELTNTATFNVMVERDDDDDDEKQKKSAPEEPKKKDSRKKK